MSGASHRIVHREIIDKETSEVREYIEYVPTKRRPTKRRGFMLVWPDEMIGLNLTGRDYRLLWALRDDVLPDTGQVRYRLAEVAERMGMEGPNAQQQAWSAMQRLIKSGVVLKTGRGEVTLNPLYLWMGSAESQAQAMMRLGIEETENENADQANEEA